jgi:hypothetical protein
LFKGIKEGTATIVSSFEELSDTAIVTVEVLEGSAVIDSMDSIDGWTIIGKYFDEENTTLSVVDTPKTTGSAAIRLDYQFIRSSFGRSYIYLNTDIQISGLPDSVLLDVKSDGQGHWIKFIVANNDDDLFIGSTGQFADQANNYDTLRTALDNYSTINPPSNFHYPINFRSIEIRLGFYTTVDDTNRGYIYFDNLRVKYPDLTSVIPFINDIIPREIKLYQNYPNPFNSSTTVEFDLSKSGKAVLTIFDITGREVKELINRNLSYGHHKVHWDTNSLASGLYFYRLDTDSQTATKKMMLLK